MGTQWKEERDGKGKQKDMGTKMKEDTWSPGIRTLKSEEI